MSFNYKLTWDGGDIRVPQVTVVIHDDLALSIKEILMVEPTARIRVTKTEEAADQEQVRSATVGNWSNERGEAEAREREKTHIKLPYDLGRY